VLRDCGFVQTSGVIQNKFKSGVAGGLHPDVPKPKFRHKVQPGTQAISVDPTGHRRLNPKVSR
jgi:hypothetical protein